MVFNLNGIDNIYILLLLACKNAHLIWNSGSYSGLEFIFLVNLCVYIISPGNTQDSIGLN